MARSTDLLQGSLDLLVLKVLTLESLHGWAIAKRVRELSRDVLTVNQGSLYPALYRLEARGWIDSSEGVSPEGRPVRFYRLSSLGRKHFADERAQWRLFSAAVDEVLSAS